MADTPAATPAAAPAAATPAAPASDADLFGKFTAIQQAAVAAELGKDSDADSSTNVRGRGAGVAPASAAAGSHARVSRGGEDAGAERHAAGRETDDAGAAAGSEVDGADGEAAGAGQDPAQTEQLSEVDAVALLRKSRAEGDQAGIDRALKALMPDSKGLAEFNVDGSRYAQFRATTAKVQKKLDARASELSVREQNVSRGLAQVEALVQRYQPVEQLLLAAQGDDVDAFITLVEKATGKPINETVKRHLDKKLGKPVDPELDAVKRELRAEKDKREAREKAEAEARQQAEHREQIRQHLVFLDDTLGKSEDSRVRALVKTDAGMRAIFEAQRAHYNPKTKQTLSAEQAAKWVLAQKQKELEPWQQVLGSPKPAPSPPAADPAPADAPRVRSLGNRGGAPASGGAQRLSDTELFEKYERLAKLAGD